jgi:hypothetical protein
MTKTLTISTKNNYLTLINVFTVDPANQQKLIDLLTMATETTKNIILSIQLSRRNSKYRKNAANPPVK